MPPTGLEPAIPSSDRPQAHAIDHKATGIKTKNMNLKVWFTELCVLPDTSLPRPLQITATED
jgi:hypothetical protein